jgi:hypothetical protein
MKILFLIICELIEGFLESNVSGSFLKQVVWGSFV